MDLLRPRPSLPTFMMLLPALWLGAPAAQAADARTDWVVQAVYADNHPLAATDSADLATKMSVMNQDAFAFYRGTAGLFYRDMATLPASRYASTASSFTWLGGDTHLGNFGATQDSAGNTVFAVDDFDEGYLGPYVWDLRRAAVSFVLAGQSNGLSDSSIATAIDTFVSAYVQKMKDFSGNNGEKSFLLKSGNTSGAVKDTLSASAGDKRSDLLAKYTQLKGSARSFVTSSTLVPVGSSTYSSIVSGVASYVQTIAASKQYDSSFYKVKDIRQKMGSGVGSLGKLRYFVLIEGASSSTSDDVILELKQATVSNVAQADAGQLPGSAYGSHEGCRIARTAKAQLSNADVLIGYTTIDSQPFYVHEKSPYAEDFDITALTSAGKLNTAATYLAQALASAHALADQDYDASVVPYSIDKQVGDAVTSQSGLSTELVNFAFDYAAQVQLDWQSFQSSYAAGATLY